MSLGYEEILALNGPQDLHLSQWCPSQGASGEGAVAVGAASLWGERSVTRLCGNPFGGSGA